MRSPLLALLLLLLAATTARAQEAELTRALERLAGSWARGDAAAVAALVAETGISLDVDGEAVGPLGTRQAAAVLRRIFEERETVSLRTGRTRVVGGAPSRAFGELAWTARARGTTIPQRATVFVAMIREPAGWRLTQIRLLP